LIAGTEIVVYQCAVDTGCIGNFLGSGFETPFGKEEFLSGILYLLFRATVFTAILQLCLTNLLNAKLIRLKETAKRKLG